MKKTISKQEKNDTHDALKLIEKMRIAWIETYLYADSTEYDKHFALKQIDKIDSYINEYFGKQKWNLIVKDL